MQTRSPVSGWALTVVLAVIAILFYEIRLALLPFVAAITIAFITDPLIVWLQHRLGWRRGAAATLVYIVLLLVFLAGGYWIATLVVIDMMHLAAQAPQMTHRLITELMGTRGIKWFGHTYGAAQIEAALSSAAAASVGPHIAATVGATGAAAIAGLTLTLVLVLYFLISGHRLAAGALWLIPPERRHSVVVLLPKLIPALRRYLVGLVGVVTYTTSLAYIGFGIVFSLPHAVLLAMAVGVLELIPVIGPVASGALVGLVALQQKDLFAAGTLVAFAVALRLSIDNLVGPLVLGHAAKLHPVVIIFAFLCGAMLFGAIGLLLAVPAAACIKIILEHYYAEPAVGERGS